MTFKAKSWGGHQYLFLAYLVKEIVKTNQQNCYLVITFHSSAPACRDILMVFNGFSGILRDFHGKSRVLRDFKIFLGILRESKES